MIDTKIFDAFEHIGVYVVDKKSMTVYYENPLAERYTGRRRIGEPCYKIHGNDSMCSSCPIRKKDHLTLVGRSDYNMILAVRCEEIIWEGHESYMVTVVKQADSAALTEEERAISRMNRALQKTVNVYTEINMETMHYWQMNLRDFGGFNTDAEGDYPAAFEYMCAEEIHPEDVPEIRRALSPEVLRKISRESEGVQEVSARYRMKHVEPERVMECRAIFMRDEIPHYVVCATKDVTSEVRLHERADAMESILSHVSCGVAIYNMTEDGTVTVEYANEGLARLAECSKEILMHQFENDFMFGVSAEHRQTFLDACERIAAGEKEAETTLYATTYKGNDLWLHTNLTASQKVNGVLQIYGTYFDVTSDVKTQKEFREKFEVAKRRTRNDASILAYAVFDLVNDRTIEMERKSPFDKVTGLFRLEQFRADICHSIVSKEQRDKFAEMIEPHNLLKMHEKGIDEQSLEFQRRLPNGKIIWVKSSVRVIADSGKNTILLFYYCNDINISKSIELMTSYMVDEDYDMIGYINLVDDDAIMLYGKGSSIRSAGHTALQTREKYSKALEWFVNYAIVPEERKFYHTNAFVEKIRENLKQKQNYEFILHVQDAKQGIRTKKIRYTRSGDDIDSCFFSQLDITDTLAEEEEKQKRLQAALDSAKQANEAKTAFLSRVSHDMRTPLNGIIGLTDMIKEKVTDENALHDVEQLELSGQYLLHLVTDTLDVSRIENGKLELHPAVCDGHKALESVLNLAKPNMEAKHLHFVIRAGDLPFSYLYLDVGRVEQVVMNILSNAIKFTPEGGTITLTLENLSVKDNVITDRLTIEDTGVGIGEEFLPHLFEPFSQEDNGVTSATNGTGLGMIITKQIIELMGGTIEVESEKGKGTKFTVVLPLNMATDEQIKQWKETETVVYNADELSEKRILLCEDHPLNATITTRLLVKKGMMVEHAVNGEMGVTMFTNSAEGYYDAILMDIRMPVMDGITATRTIRALPRRDATTIPIIAVTANAFEEDIKNTEEVGMNAHLSKPIDKNALYETLEKTLHLHRSFKRKKILIVDDVEVNREVLKASLRDEYTILEAANGKDAVRILESTTGIDVVITDIQMPEMDGVQLIKQIKADPKYRRIAILANTQYGDPSQEEDLLALGADDFVYKPSTPNIVKSRVRSVLRK